eukprot:CAMPEP_0175896308 /NCGR_PEP_ID=MMETSP0108-20121206/96_1 /TAXON_ID=195067 ORGANISM="Goniomonas pacifica, Strain CCMP1869" /NCGR_SAMPLE_ID=MMETSP0108 /ASSEMBLY_ACC=CAM_ASM_000204 /LENGTH=42 /DNA_ID= /DNA_START= /DNA_END= /DNA_ORIENTATION=
MSHGSSVDGAQDVTGFDVSVVERNVDKIDGVIYTIVAKNDAH